MSDSQSIWTIGHSSHPGDAFLELLASDQLEVVVDVRSYPFSRFAPQFNREELEAMLAKAGLTYLFLGEELGGRPSRADHYDAEGHALYGAMAQEPPFQKAVDRLLRGVASHRIALMCSEGRPHECHRRLLVGRVLAERGVTLRHILPDASLLTEEEVSLAGEGGGQAALFDEAASVWRSTQSVSRRRRLNTSSAA